MKLFILIAVLVLTGWQVRAATFTVTHTLDTGAGSLRQAITDANSNPGPDNIFFNIPTTDPGYNSGTGVWTILPATDLPMLSGGFTTIDAATQTTNQGNTNLLGPEIVLDGQNLRSYGFRIVSPGNMLSSMIIGRCDFGIQFYGALTTGNRVQNCFIGIAADGAAPFPNNYGTGLAGGATGITITQNVISGNIVAGIAATGATNLSITANHIGTTADGNGSCANPSGIVLDNTSGCTIGGSSPASGNLVSGNTDAGIVLNNAGSTGNSISGNRIGTNALASDSLPNGNGITLNSAPGNTIGGSSSGSRNIISGNTACGILIQGTGANDNLIAGNFIGTDARGVLPLSNHYGIIIKADADRNTIGGSTSGERNLISANLEIGVYVEASDSNQVSGNYIGTDSSGTGTFAWGDTLIQANGVEINTLSRNNIIGGSTPGTRNVISGNRVYGAILYGQVSYNTISGNYIGTDFSGNFPLPNATGICVDDASNRNTIEHNLLSGNVSYGIFIVTTGSEYNIFRGNLVGTNASGTDTIPNDVGLLIAGGAKYNQIGGSLPSDQNLFSGNHYGGIELVDNGTSGNIILGNIVGMDLSGSIPLPNRIGVVVSALVTNTTIDSNLISGNATFGLVLTDASSGSSITRNRIGVGSDGISPAGNGASGIVINQSAHHNQVGAPGMGNTIAYNDSAGIVIMDNGTTANTLTANRIYDNGFLGIDIYPWGVNANDVGDVDAGANLMMNFPEILSAAYDSTTGQTRIQGILDAMSPAQCTVALFRAAPDLLTGHGEAFQWLGTTTPDLLGNWILLVPGVLPGAIITATATDSAGNTSEFSINKTTTVGLQDAITAWMPDIFIYPNPVSERLYISTNRTKPTDLQLLLTDVEGRTVLGLHLHLDSGSPVVSVPVGQLPSGCYALQISGDGHQTLHGKITLITAP